MAGRHSGGGEQGGLGEDQAADSGAGIITSGMARDDDDTLG